MDRAIGRHGLHGRGLEGELLDDRLERAAAGTLQAMVIEGEAGIGKTRLLEATLARAAERGFEVFVGRADEVERARPFGPLVTALDGTAAREDPERAQLADLLTEDSAPDRDPIAPTRDPGLRFRVIDWVVDLVEELALAGPVALAVDDLHWADPATLLTLRSLTRRLGDLPVALLATMRPVPRGSELEQLLAALAVDGSQHVVLGPLDDDAIAEVVAEVVGAEPGASLRHHVACAAGNPLFATELVSALGEEGAVAFVDGRAEIGDVSLPPSLRLTILRRLSFLDQEKLDVLQLAAVLGATFSVRDIAVVLDRPATTLLGTVRVPIQAGVLEESDGRLRFRHELIREALYEDLPEDVRGALHLEAAQRLEATGASPLKVAEHLALGAQPGDAGAVDRLRVAARDVARHAPEIAVDLLERALELARGSSNLRPAILADLVPVLLWRGAPELAEARAREALAELPPATLLGPLRLGLVRALAAQGRHQDVIDTVGRVLQESRLTPELQSQLHAEAANSLGFVGDLDAKEAAARQAVTAGTPVRSEGAVMGLLVLSDGARGRGRLHQSLEYAEEASRLAQTRGGRLHWRPEIFMAMALRSLDRFDEADRVLRDGRRVDERLGYVSFLPVYHYESATGLFYAGQWDDGLTQAETGLALAHEVGLGMLRSWPYGVLALIAVHRGELQEAESWLAAYTDHPDLPTAASGGPNMVLAQALLDEARGDADGARDLLAHAWESDAASGHVAGRRVLGPDLVRLTLAAGDHTRVTAVADAMEEAAERAAVPSLEGAALRCRGLAEDDAGLLRQSVEAYRQSPRVFERASACDDAAAALARAEQVPEAIALFDEALDVYDAVGAHRASARTLATMRELGITRRRQSVRKRPTTGWESLTPAEHEVVRLAAEGLTNPQIGARLFVSPRTVQTHLAHAFRKLGLNSRVQLAAEVTKRESPG